MTFRELPRNLKLYIATNILLLIPIGYGVWCSPAPTHAWLFGTLLFFTFVFSTWKIELTVLQAKMTLTFAVVCVALLTDGLQAAIYCAMLGAIVGTYLRPVAGSWRVTLVYPPFHRTLFNIANCGLSCVLSWTAYILTVRYAPVGDLGQVLGLTAFTGCYFLVNTLGVALAISQQQRLSWLMVWKQSFLWTAPGYFASSSAAVAIHAGYMHFGLWSMFFLPWLYVVYYSYRLYMDRLRKDMDHIQELNKLNRSIIAALATAIDAKDRYTCSHINRVHHYAVVLAEELGSTGAEMEAIATGALVHDIGKLGIPDRILGKPGKLTPDEFERIKTHVAIGAEILSPIPFPFPVVDVVRTHHERWDGLGYPLGLQGESIPLGGRIISVVDVFDALTSDRPYRRAMTQDEALAVLREGSAKQFDPAVVEAFARILPAASRSLEAEEQEAIRQAESAESAEDTGSALTRISQAAAEMAAVCEVAHALVDQDTVEGVATVVLNRALTLLPVDTVALYLTSPDDSTLVASAVDGKYKEKLAGMTIQKGEGVSGWVAGSQQARVNVAAALDVARRFDPEENMDLTAATAVPVVHGPDNIGVLTVYTTAYNLLNDHHLHVLNILAEHAAAAMQNLRRFERHREMAYTDPLTGLVNSRSLFRHLDRMTFAGGATPRGGFPPFSVVMLDLDGFKNVNDTLGHLRGDDLLRSVADTLGGIARPEDVVCRYAGDEFVVLLPGSGISQAERMADRIRIAVAAIGPVDGRVEIGASVGVASCPEDGSDGTTLLNTADCRMYQDKFERRGRRLLAAAENSPTRGAVLARGR